MINGNECILSWNGEVIACLTSNSISEVLTFLATSKKTINGSQTFAPVANSYAINFEAVMTSDSVMSWAELSALAKSMRLGTWEFDLGGAIPGDAGFGFLSNLEMTAISGDLITFTGTIIGYGIIRTAPLTLHVWYQDVDTPVDEGGNYVLVAL